MIFNYLIIIGGALLFLLVIRLLPELMVWVEYKFMGPEYEYDPIKKEFLYFDNKGKVIKTKKLRGDSNDNS